MPTLKLFFTGNPISSSANTTCPDVSNKELRQNLGWNQEELAEGICISSYISVLENNLMTPFEDVM